jgi:hypothetical protein
MLTIEDGVGFLRQVMRQKGIGNCLIRTKQQGYFHNLPITMAISAFDQIAIVAHWMRLDEIPMAKGQGFKSPKDVFDMAKDAPELKEAINSYYTFLDDIYRAVESMIQRKTSRKGIVWQSLDGQFILKPEDFGNLDKEIIARYAHEGMQQGISFENPYFEMALEKFACQKFGIVG